MLYTTLTLAACSLLFRQAFALPSNCAALGDICKYSDYAFCNPQTEKWSKCKKSGNECTVEELEGSCNPHKKRWAKSTGEDASSPLEARDDAPGITTPCDGYPSECFTPDGTCHEGKKVICDWSLGDYPCFGMCFPTYSCELRDLGAC